MSDNDFKPAKISIPEVLREAIKLYKENAALFLKISALLALVGWVADTLDLFRSLLTPSPLIYLYLLCYFLLSLILFYFSLKFSIAVYICIAARLKKENITVKKALQKVPEIFWRYVLVNIKYFFILLLPLIVIFGSFFAIKEPPIKWAVIAIAAIPAIYLQTLYTFAPLTAIVEKERKTNFKMSKALVKGDFWQVLLLTSVLLLALAVPFSLYVNGLNGAKAILPLTKYLSSTLDQLLSLFIDPFIYSVGVILYYKLKANKKVLLKNEMKPANTPPAFWAG